ncbi:MAG: TetR/AcrR family transcriptional regulator [Pseudomonadota bacterium]
MGSTNEAIKDKTYHHGDLRAALIREGRTMVEESGIGSLGLRAAARRVGVSQAAPAYHFGDKAGLLAAIAAQGFDDLRRQRVAALKNAESAEHSVKTMIDLYVDFALNNEGVFRLMFGDDLVRSSFPELLKIASQSFRVFSDTVEAYCTSLGITGDKADLATMTAWSLEHGLANLLLARQIPLSLKPVGREELQEAANEILILGIRAFAKQA